jgi:hypothetical protein
MKLAAAFTQQIFFIKSVQYQCKVCCLFYTENVLFEVCMVLKSASAFTQKIFYIKSVRSYLTIGTIS